MNFDASEPVNNPFIRPVGHLLPLARGRRDFLNAGEKSPGNPASLFGRSANPMLRGVRQSPDSFRTTGGSCSPCLMNFIDTEFTQCRVFFAV